MKEIGFVVIGDPAPKGSFRIVTRGHSGRPLPHPKVLKDSPRTQTWHVLVAMAARAAMVGHAPFAEVPLCVQITFRLQRPASHIGKRGVLPSAPEFPAVKPDIDKLARATLDPLEGIVFDGDSRVVDLALTKLYAAHGSPGGATIIVKSAI